MKSLDHVLNAVNDELRLTKSDPLKKLRLFNESGVELYEQDLQFVKDGDLLYVSKGDDFDVMTYYD